MRYLLITLEQKFGRFAIPGLVRFIMIAQVAVWLIMQVSEGGAGLLGLLFFEPFAVLDLHQWWRALTFLAVPVGGGLLWLLMGVPFMWMISDGLEEAWGAFRVNLYLLACVVCVVAEGLILHESISSWAILSSLVVAYAIYYPDQIINLYGVIPIKMKWIGWMDFGFLLFTFIGHAETRWYLAAALLPFFVVFGPAMTRLLHHQARTMERRHRFMSAQRSTDDALHRCSRCGKTDTDHPGLEFRVNAEGDDVCAECRAAGR